MTNSVLCLENYDPVKGEKRVCLFKIVSKSLSDFLFPFFPLAINYNSPSQCVLTVYFTNNRSYFFVQGLKKFFEAGLHVA